jgi:hypothetical protein
VNDVRDLLRQVLQRWTRWWGNLTRSTLLGRFVAKKTPPPATIRSAEERARFWAELRAGQREAAQRSNV